MPVKRFKNVTKTKSRSHAKESGSGNIIASGYLNLGELTFGLGDYDKAKEYLEQAVLITEQIGDINGVVASCRMLGTALHFLDDYSKAREYHKKAASVKRLQTFQWK